MHVGSPGIVTKVYKFVELTPGTWRPENIYMYLNIKVTAYQFGTVGSCPTEFLILLEWE